MGTGYQQIVLQQCNEKTYKLMVHPKEANSQCGFASLYRIIPVHAYEYLAILVTAHVGNFEIADGLSEGD